MQWKSWIHHLLERFFVQCTILKKFVLHILKFIPDMGNLTQFSADVESEFELGISETVAIHVKETNPGVFKCVPFGEGTVRFTDIFKKLKDLNYTGMFLIEMWADNTKKQTMEEAVETIRQARLFVEDKMEQAGIKVPA